MHLRKRHIILFFLLLGGVYLGAQSASFGNTFIHNEGESVIFGLHDFDKGSFGTVSGIVGTQRTNDTRYGLIGWSDVSPGWRNAADDRYVDGYVKTYGNRPFVFPIGDNGKYRPIAIDGAEGTIAAYYEVDPASAVTSTVYGGDYEPLPLGGPFPQSQSEDLVINISELEYWDVDGTNPTNITLTWDIFSEIEEITNQLDRLSIVGWDGSRWVAIESEVDRLYLNEERSNPRFNGGVSNLTQGSITTLNPIVPDQYLAYTFGSLASGSIGNFVWEDLNRNGIQETGEPGLEGVEVLLIDANTEEVVMTTESDENGAYLFVGVTQGAYFLEFNPTQGFVPTLGFRDNPAFDSDLNLNGKTEPFMLDVDENLLQFDGGFFKTGSIGDLVWFDENGDGIQDPSENGIGLVSVELLDDLGNTVASTTSNDDGSYSFTNVVPGIYIVRVNPPSGLGIGPFKATTDIELDSDIDPLTGLSDPITVLSGEQILNIDGALSEECRYVAEIDIVAPECGTSNGSVQAFVDGDTGPYTYEWSTGATTDFIDNIDTGHYTLLITDTENCTRAFNIDVVYADECELMCTTLDVQVYLEGAYDFDKQEMRTTLNELGYLPGQRPPVLLASPVPPGHPYDEEPWFINTTTGEDFRSSSPAENNLYYEESVVDWVLVSLRSTEDREYEACTRAGLLHSDGQITFPDDNCCLVDPTKSYFMVVEHRNHMIVMSPSRVPVVDNTLAFDFRHNQSFKRLLGDTQKEIAPGVFAMYAGNGDQYLSSPAPVDINSDDLSEWQKQNGTHSGYYRHDFDFTSDVNAGDKRYPLQNNGKFTDVRKGN